MCLPSIYISPSCLGKAGAERSTTWCSEYARWVIGCIYWGDFAEMLRSIYVSYIILGHSERRQYCRETNRTINDKILSAIKANLKPIYCVGETLEERETGQTME